MKKILTESGGDRRNQSRYRPKNRQDRIQEGIGDGDGIHPGFGSGDQKSRDGPVIGPLSLQGGGRRQNPAGTEGQRRPNQGSLEYGRETSLPQMAGHGLRIHPGPHQAADDEAEKNINTRVHFSLISSIISSSLFLFGAESVNQRLYCAAFRR